MIGKEVGKRKEREKKERVVDFLGGWKMRRRKKKRKIIKRKERGECSTQE